MISERSNALVGEAALPPHEGLLTSIREDIGCVRTRDPAASSRLESLLIYPGVHAVIWHRIAHRLWNGNAKKEREAVRSFVKTRRGAGLPATAWKLERP